MTTNNGTLDLEYIKNTESSERLYEGPTEDYDAADCVKALKGVRIA